MKKSLFLLAALATTAIASAETTWTDISNASLSYRSTDTGWYSTYTMDSLTFTFCIPEAVVTDTQIILAYVTAGYEAYSGTAQNTFLLEKDSEAGSYTLWAKQTSFGTDVDSFSINSASLITGLQENVNYTLSVIPDATGSIHSNLTLTDDNGETLSASYTFTNYLRAPESMTEATVTPIARMNAAFAPVQSSGSESIPEPATASLSLLALTGLAARRRRK